MAIHEAAGLQLAHISEGGRKRGRSSFFISSAFSAAARANRVARARVSAPIVQPTRTAERAITFQAQLELLHLFPCEWRVDEFGPVRWAIDRPFREHGCHLFGAFLPRPEAAPAPFLRAANQTGGKSIALYISATQ